LAAPGREDGGDAEEADREADDHQPAAVAVAAAAVAG
jgi:hypothetical protein